MPLLPAAGNWVFRYISKMKGMTAEYFILLNPPRVFCVGAGAWVAPVEAAWWLWQGDNLCPCVRGGWSVCCASLSSGLWASPGALHCPILPQLLPVQLHFALFSPWFQQVPKSFRSIPPQPAKTEGKKGIFWSFQRCHGAVSPQDPWAGRVKLILPA